MAIRRAKQKAQVIAKLAEVAPPGETFITTVHCETGPSPWLNSLFDEVPFLGLIVAFTRKFYFITLTNTSILVNTSNRFTNRPGDIVFAFPIAQFPVVSYKRVRVWSSMFVQFPGGSKPTRVDIHGYWNRELDLLLAALPKPGVPAQAAPSQVPSPVIEQQH